MWLDENLLSLHQSLKMYCQYLYFPTETIISLQTWSNLEILCAHESFLFTKLLTLMEDSSCTKVYCMSTSTPLPPSFCTFLCQFASNAGERRSDGGQTVEIETTYVYKYQHVIMLIIYIRIQIHIFIYVYKYQHLTYVHRHCRTYKKYIRTPQHPYHERVVQHVYLCICGTKI